MKNQRMTKKHEKFPGGKEISRTVNQFELCQADFDERDTTEAYSWRPTLFSNQSPSTGSCFFCCSKEYQTSLDFIEYKNKL